MLRLNDILLSCMSNAVLFEPWFVVSDLAEVMQNPLVKSLENYAFPLMFSIDYISSKD